MTQSKIVQLSPIEPGWYLGCRLDNNQWKYFRVTNMCLVHYLEDDFSWEAIHPVTIEDVTIEQDNNKDDMVYLPNETQQEFVSKKSPEELKIAN